MRSEHPPHGLREALAAAVFRTVLRVAMRPRLSPRVPIGAQRRWLDAFTKVALLTRGVTVTPAPLAGRPGEWLQPPTPPVRPGVVLYLHGGAYCVGSPATHRGLTSRLARDIGLPVFALDYRLAPEHPYPAALEDALAAARALRDRGPLVIAGDSAGAGLALAVTLALRDAGEPLPAAQLLISPWVDLDPASLAARPQGDALLDPAWPAACAPLYAGALPLSDPRVSPLHADLRGLPPTLIQAGSAELLCPQAEALHARLGEAGVTAQLDLTPGRWHDFQLHANALPSADAAIARLAAFAAAPLAAATPPVEREHEVVILGAGMSGLAMGHALQRAGLHDFVMLEKQPGLGGTWWDNTYPGAHVDVPAPAYSLSFAPNPLWQRRFAAAPEIQRYMQRTAERLGLTAHLRPGVQLTEARWDEDSARWRLRTTRGDVYTARFFVCSTGPLNQPRWPAIPGLEAFTGQKLHSARWDAGVPLAGKRIGVIGTGSTASQLIPPLAAQAGQLTVFQRTANWVLPRLDRRYGTLDRWLAGFPPYAKLVRWFWVGVMEWGRRGFDEGTLARRSLLQGAQLLRDKQVADPALRAQLTPPYPLGCKRIIYSNDYYPALTRPNVALETGTIERITPDGIRLADGRQVPLDVLVCATGFETIELLSSITVAGRGGRTLREAWAAGPEAYHGITVAGFPNLFLMLGPNTATGHTSTLLYIEPEVAHALACMQRVREGGHRSIEVREPVFRAHNQALQQRLAGSVWSLCRSWYRTADGKITALFPGFTREYRRAVTRPDFNDYSLD